MIVSHKHNFVYVKPGKTAGSSIELAISAYCGPQDVITRLRPREEYQRGDCAARIENPQFVNINSGETIELQNHSRYSDALRVYGEQIVDYDVVCTERNPWEKAISSFFWKGNRRPERPVEPRFKRFVNDGRWPQDFDVYSVNGVCVADHIIRVERLKEDYRDFLGSLGIVIEGEISFPASKGFQRPKEATREVMFTRPWVIRAVEEHSQELRSVLPYRFEERSAPEIHLSPDRRTARYRFLEQNACGPAYWQRVPTSTSA
ncbi:MULTISPECIES: hypothetical protein [unclassified Phaeobacter]|uniref:hypothetical protein n=1 Tax=unclassified Phaeobacter TaxID=2621772 RepID=UPI003A8B6607